MEVVTSKLDKKGRISITKHLAVFLLIIFIASLIGTGLIVYHFSTPQYIPNNIIKTIEVCNNTQSEDTSTSSLLDEVIESTTEVSIVATTSKASDLDVRLPTNLIPESYQIKLITYLHEQNFTFSGEVNILVNVTQSTDKIVLHSDELIIEKSSVAIYEMINDTFFEAFSILEIGKDLERQFLIIVLDKFLEEDKQYTIHIEYTGILNDLLQGFYRSSYSVNNEIRWIASTQFQPTDARKAFPCFDEPALKARFTLSLARPENLKTISNMPLVRTEKVDNLEEYVWDHFQESVPMSTYLVAFVVCDFDYLVNGNFAVWARHDALPQAKHSLEVGPKLLKFYEDYFKIKYPLPKLDMIALPDFAAGAMENWGLITYRESAMLYEEGVSSKSNLQRITSVIAHECAHQWFGNLVTPRWWTDLWLNEGFASYMEYIATDAVKPEWKVLDQFVVHEVQNVLALDGLKSSHQISIKVNNPNEINDIFDRISYAKGATIIRMMEQFLSSDVFRSGLTNYLNNRRYSNAEQDDLWFALTEQAYKDGVLSEDMSVKEIMDTWTLQTGFPVVFIARDYNSSFITLKQKRYLLESSNINEKHDLMWWIPVTYNAKNTTSKTVWMKAEPKVTFLENNILPDDWILVNIDQKGYYRVNYDINNWKLLTRQLLDKNGFTKISLTNRAQIIDDSLNLALAGYLDYDVALDITKYLIHERECIPWMSAFTALDYIQEMFIRTANFDKFKVYMTTIIDGLYKHVGFEDSFKDTQLTIYNRMNLLWRACLLGNLDCIRNAVTYFHNWRSSPNPDHNNPISPNLKNVVYCMAIRAGGQEEWDFAWKRYLNTNVGSERDILLSALGCTRETWLLSRYLHWAVTEGSGIRKQDSARVFSSVANNVIGQELTYRFFKNNWREMKKYMGSSIMLLNAIVKTCTSKFNTQEELDDFKNYVDHNFDELGIVSRTLEQSIEQVEANVKWMNRNYKNIVQWLTKFQITKEKF